MIATAGAALAATFVSAQGPEDLAAIMARVGTHVEAYYARAQSLMCLERVVLQPVGRDRFPNAAPRRLDFELRVEWQSSEDGQPAAATINRELVRVNGRPPRTRDPRDECLDPKPVSPEPLMMLLPSRQPEYLFTWRGRDRLDDRELVTIDYRARTPGPPVIAWSGNCGSVDVPALVRGRVWVDPASGEVLRVDERIAGTFDIALPADKTRFGGALFWTLERADSSIRFAPVHFTDPEETLLLPERIESYFVVRNSGVPQLRTSQTFSDCRRFLTGGRIVR